MDAKLSARIELWLERDPDPKTVRELEELVESNDVEELERRFGDRLAFGTAGLRGVVGAGPARMNRLVIQQTSLGLGHYLLDVVDDADQRGVVVGYDGRLDSEEFARDTAAALVSLGLPVRLADKPVPTPVCAFAVKHFNAAAGVVVTASHNPPEYNGYKVYWGNGAQIIPPHDQGIAAAIDEVAAAPLPPLDAENLNDELVQPFGSPLYDEYLAAIRTLSIHSDRGNRAELAIAYTAMHGVGASFVETALKQAGFERVVSVPEQREPDGNFPTVEFPNPEEPGAMDLVTSLAREHNAIIAIANDPDADRLAVAALNEQGEYEMLSGNQVGFLLGADQLQASGGAASVGTTIVSSQLLGEMAAKAGVGYFETLTGFKWIANQAMSRKARNPDETFLFGYEEALGYTIGELVRDKDGVSAAMVFAELAAELAAENETVFDQLDALYRRFGIFVTEQKSIWLDEDADEEPSLTDKLRVTAPAEIAGLAVVWRADLREGKAVSADGETEVLDFPVSDVLIYRLEGGARVIVRPSGTEPKIKSYYEVRGQLSEGETVARAEERARAKLDELVTRHQSELALLRGDS